MEINSFLYIGLLAGLAQIFDGIIFFLNHHKISGLSYLTSTIEFLWFFVCVWILVTLPLEGILLAIPVIYIAYNITGWIYGYQFYKKYETSEEMLDAQFPPFIAYGEMLSGSIYLVLSLVAITGIHSS
jgi:hypothetical protein